MATITRKVVEELNRLEAKHGTLRPEQVVKRAKNPRSPLHDHFTWDDRSAAARHRIAEARTLIQRVRVWVTPSDGAEPQRVRAYVSLSSDRVDGGGYRQVAKVLADQEQRNELLRTALRELASLRRKYHALSELAAVIDAIEAAEGEITIKLDVA